MGPVRHFSLLTLSSIWFVPRSHRSEPEACSGLSCRGEKRRGEASLGHGGVNPALSRGATGAGMISYRPVALWWSGCSAR